MNNWDKRLAREAMKWGFNPENPKLYEQDLEEKFKDPWGMMSKEDNLAAYKLFRMALKHTPGSQNQKKVKAQLNAILAKYKLKPIPEERMEEAQMMVETFTMQNLYDFRLMLLALITDENMAKIRQQFQTKQKPPAATATPPKSAAANPAKKVANKES